MTAHDDRARDEQPAPATIRVDKVKMTREALCVAQAALLDRARSGVDARRVPHWVDDIGRIIEQLDEHRPLGPDGKHGNRHTPTCGCEDKP